MHVTVRKAPDKKTDDYRSYLDLPFHKTGFQKSGK